MTLDAQTTARERLSPSSATHALVIGEVVLTSGRDRAVPGGRQAGDPASRRLPRAGRARRRAGARLGRHRGRRDDDGGGPDRVRRARRRRRRQGVLRPQGGQAARPRRAGSKARRSTPASAACSSRTWSRPAARRSARSRRSATRATRCAACSRSATGSPVAREAIEEAAGAPFVALTTIDEVYPDRPDRGPVTATAERPANDAGRAWTVVDGARRRARDRVSRIRERA